MSDIRINVPEDRTVIILKRIQNKIGGYKGYKDGGDARISTQSLYDEIRKRTDICLSNMSAALENLEMYGKMDESNKAREIFKEIGELKNLHFDLPSNPVPVSQEKLQELYFSDEIGFKNSIDLLDNINSFRSASISGDFDEGVLSKIKGNVESIKKFVVERNSFLSVKN